MSLIWIIGGAGRGVGKTTVALRLCSVLPASVYAKSGHGTMQSDKPCNFFNDPDDLYSFIDANRHSKQHIVIESNAMITSGFGDLTIFIDGVAQKTDFRDDAEQLAAAADIRISGNADVASWKKTVLAHVGSTAISDAVCGILSAQRRYLFGTRPTVRSKIWFEAAGAHIFGNGLAGVLENVNRFGTLQEAARASHMSYRYAWDLIRTAEKHFGKALINRHTGGRHGGGSTLSSSGLHLLEVFKDLNEQVAIFTDKTFKDLYAMRQRRG